MSGPQTDRFDDKAMVKGTMLRAHLSWATNRFGNDLEPVTPGIPPPSPDLPLAKLVLPTDWIPFSDLIALDRAIAAAAGGDPEETWLALGRHSAALNLTGVYKSFISGEPHRFFERMTVLHHQFQTFGRSVYERLGEQLGTDPDREPDGLLAGLLHLGAGLLRGGAPPPAGPGPDRRPPLRLRGRAAPRPASSSSPGEPAPGAGPYGPEGELALLEHVARTIGDFVLVTDVDGNLTWVNEAVLERSGWTRERAPRAAVAALPRRREPARPRRDGSSTATRAGGFRGDILNVTQAGRGLLGRPEDLDSSGGTASVAGFVVDLARHRRAQARRGRADGGARRGGGGEPGQDRVPREHQPRDPDADERRHRHGGPPPRRPPLTPEQRDYVETIRTSGDTLLTLLNDVLDFSKMESERLELESRPVLPRATPWRTPSTSSPRGRRRRASTSPTASTPSVPRDARRRRHAASGRSS